MASLETLYVAVLLAGAAFSTAVGVFAARHRPASGARELTVFMAGVALWMAMTAVTNVADDLAVFSIAERLSIAGAALVVLGYVTFTFSYTGRDRYLAPAPVAAIAAVPAAAIVLAWINPMDLFWIDIRRGASPTGFVVEWGPAFWAFVAYSYGLLLVGTVLLVGTLFRSPYVYQRQIVAVLLGVSAPWLGNAVFLFTPLSVDPAPLAFLLTGAAFTWAMARVDFMDLTPVAREKVVEDIGHGVFVLDDANRFVDINATGRRMLAVGDERVLGRRLEDVVSAYPGLVEEYRDVDESIDEVTITTPDGPVVLRVEVSPLSDSGGTRVGRLFLVQDVTRARRRERELRRANEQLERFAGVVGHDLRNPLNLVEGYVDLARETGDLAYLDDADRGLERMNRLLADLLSLAREGRAVADLAPVSLADVAGDAWDTVDTGQATLERDDVTVLADRERLRQVFENLFRNAVHHAGPDVTVRVGTLADDAARVADRGGTESELRGFYVADDGPGLPEPSGGSVFDHGYTSNEEGTGLGLSIVESIATAHGWDVSATSASSGGARFEFTGVTCPRRPPASEPPVEPE